MMLNGIGDKLRHEVLWQPNHIVTICNIAKELLMADQYNNLKTAINNATVHQIARLVSLFVKLDQKMFQNHDVTLNLQVGIWLNSGFGFAGPGALTNGTPAALAAL